VVFLRSKESMPSKTTVYQWMNHSDLHNSNESIFIQLTIEVSRRKMLRHVVGRASLDSLIPALFITIIY
jgi:hypothetical protein